MIYTSGLDRGAIMSSLFQVLRIDEIFYSLWTLKKELKKDRKKEEPGKGTRLSALD